MPLSCRILLLFPLAIAFSCTPDDPAPQPIDRLEVVRRHLVNITETDTLNALSLGNGRFAMTMDVTGLQTFPEAYRNGMSLGTQSEWGWHSFPSDEDYSIDETLAPLASHGRGVPYARQWPAGTRAWAAANYLRQNPHRVHLANVGWLLLKEDGNPVDLADIEDVNQTLDPWKGELISTFTVEGVPVTVVSLVSQEEDVLTARVKSDLIREGRLGIHLRFPYPTDAFLDDAAYYDADEAARLELDASNLKSVSVRRNLDDLTYFTRINSSLEMGAVEQQAHGYYIRPDASQDSWTFSVAFDQTDPGAQNPDLEIFRSEVQSDWQAFWQSGGMIDFGSVDDPRAAELERRMVLSLYLTRINCGGHSPPQETGLTNNSWYGKPHMEMIWWHGVHFALWGRPEILERQMSWYFRAEEVAREIAERQGFDGVRWQKMTDNEGGETASSTGSYLIWQQPHLIYFAELIYRTREDEATLEKYAHLIEETADFMADFAWYDPEKERYILPGVIPAQERFDPKVTYNPTYELAYWRWGLEAAQTWRERMGQARNEKWDEVLAGLSPLPVQGGVYLATESATDSYTTERFMTDHPSVLGAYGMLPATPGLDTAVMRATFDKVWNEWRWHDTWGWDFPMTAMTATRLGLPEKAVDALLMDITTNTYLANGHNYQTPRLRLYLPGNGGLLTALAMMAAGYDGSNTPTPGFPADWEVKWEGLTRMP